MPDGSKPRGPPGSAAPRSASRGPAPSCSACSAATVSANTATQRGSSSMPIARRGPRRDRGAEQRAADARERVEDELAGAAEELDQAGHQARRLVGAVRPSPGVAELGRVGRRPHRLREVQPLLAGELVEVVGRVWRSALVHRASVPGGVARDGAPAAPRGGQTPFRARWRCDLRTRHAAAAEARARPYNAAHAGSRGQSPVHRPGAGARTGRRRRRRVRDGTGDDRDRRRAAPGWA